VEFHSQSLSPFVPILFLELFEAMIQFGDGLGQGFCPAVLLIDVERQKKTEKYYKDQQKEENKITRQRETGPFGKRFDPAVLDGENDDQDAGDKPGEGVFEGHFLTADEIDDREQDKGCHDESEHFWVHQKPPNCFF